MAESEKEKAIRFTIEDMETLVPQGEPGADEETLEEFDERLMAQYLLIIHTRGLDVLLEALDSFPKEGISKILVQHPMLVKELLANDRHEEARQVVESLLHRPGYTKDLSIALCDVVSAMGSRIPVPLRDACVTKLRTVIASLTDPKDIRIAFIPLIRLARLSCEGEDLLRAVRFVNEMGASATESDYELLQWVLSEWPDLKVSLSAALRITNTKWSFHIRRAILNRRPVRM